MVRYKEAAAYCEELLEKNRLSMSASVTLAKWAADFWDYRKSSYVARILARSPADKPGITESFCKIAQRDYINHILPLHGH